MELSGFTLGQLNDAFEILTRQLKVPAPLGVPRSSQVVLNQRLVESVDGMTADWAHLERDLVRRISGRIINEVRGINRVVLDVSSKPPATIEWE